MRQLKSISLGGPTDDGGLDIPGKKNQDQNVPFLFYQGNRFSLVRANLRNLMDSTATTVAQSKPYNTSSDTERYSQEVKKGAGGER